MASKNLISQEEFVAEFVADNTLKNVEDKTGGASLNITKVETPNITFNHIHKRFMVLYNLADMRKVWKKVGSDFKKENGIKLPKRFKKYPEIWEMLNDWIESKIASFVLNGGQDIIFYNKADLKERGWDEKLFSLLYPNPDKKVYLGRGRYAYYYNGTKISEIEDTEEFIVHTSEKLERKRKREMIKKMKQAELANLAIKRN